MNKINVIRMLLKSIKGTTDSMKGHQVQHQNIESTISAIDTILDDLEMVK